MDLCTVLIIRAMWSYPFHYPTAATLPRESHTSRNRSKCCERSRSRGRSLHKGQHSSWKAEEISTIPMIRWLLQNTSRIATPKTLTAGPKLAPRWHHHPRRIGKPVLVTNIVFLLVEHCDQTSWVEGPDEKTGRPIAVLRVVRSNA